VAKKLDSDKLIAQQAKENAALKAKLSAKEARASRDIEDQTDWMQKLNDSQQTYVDGLDAANKAANKIKATNKEISETQNFINNNAKRLSKESLVALGAQIKLLKSHKDQAKFLAKAAINQAKIAKLEQQALPHKQKLIESQIKLNKLEEKYKESVEDSLGFIDSIDNTIKEIPIVGGFLSKALGLDTIKEELTDKFTKQLSGVLDKSSVSQKKAAEEAIKGYDSQIDKLSGVESAAGNVTGIVGDIGPAAMEGAGGVAAVEGGLMSAIPAAGGLMAALGPILPIALAIAAAVMLFKKALEIDKEVSEMARGMGMTKDEALEAHHHFLDIAEDTKIIGANAEALSAANKDLNAILGTNAIASKEMLEAQVLLTKQYGLSGEEAAAFQVTSAGTGKTVEQNLATVEAMVEGYNTMTGDSLNFKEISKDIAKTSKATLASYKGDVKALTLAAIQAKKMGMSLEDTQAAADKLLDVESSIENEMKANVLTGKHMNMNAARQLALQGKTAEAAAEAVSQAGSYDDLMAMAPYQQKAVAEAAGLTVDQLVKAAELQKYSQALNGVEVKDMKDLTEEQINQLKTAGAINKEKADQIIKENQIANNQEKLNMLADKMSAIFAGIASIMLPIIDAIGSMATGIGDGIVKSLEWVKQLWTDIAPYVEGIATTIAIMLVPSLYEAAASMVTMAVTALPSILTSVGAWLVTQGGIAIEAAATAIAAIASASALTLGLGAIAIAGGIAVAVAAMNSEEDKAKKVDDAMIDSSGGLVVSGPKGKFKLNENDSIVAGTNLSGQSTSSAIDTVSSTSSVGNSINKELVSLLKELIAKVDQPVRININGRVMDEIEKQTTLRKTYNTKVDSGYGTFG
jgi:hypothetical protein